ncbi:hypothetical protein GCM10022223_44330 [Kineosporia mesophila]|uniref:DUF4279 domain-containing protein n=1 Tax=Kineosporia mesophila TaxID=566012 RepID=A0ABP7A0Z6_9ACTN|nr:DUF4279 domain-containing protein [Kineosporia mesophila]
MRSIVSFRLTHEHGGTAAAVTERLGIPATRPLEAGTVISSRNPERTRTHSAWILSSAVEAEDDVRLPEMLERLLHQLEPVTAMLWDLEREGYAANWLGMLDVRDGENATELTRDVLLRLTALPGDLWLDVYRDDEDGPGALAIRRQLPPVDR